MLTARGFRILLVVNRGNQCLQVNGIINSKTGNYWSTDVLVLGCFQLNIIAEVLPRSVVY